MIGEIVWLMTQSQGHKHLALSDLEWLLMPPVILEQYKIFREEDRPVGAALWGYLTEEASVRLQAAGRLAPQDWGNNAIMDADKGLVAQEGGTLWLVELIAPFHTDTNKHREQILADLMQTAFKGEKFNTIRIHPQTGIKEVITLG
jgi:cytolysin-activating lysine-acyltransferase